MPHETGGLDPQRRGRVVAVRLRVDSREKRSHPIVIFLPPFFERMLVAFGAPQAKAHKGDGDGFGSVFERTRHAIERSYVLIVGLASGYQDLADHLIDRAVLL